MYICQSADDDSVIDETKNSRLQHVYRFKIPMHNNPWIKFSRTNNHQLNLHTDPNDVGVIMEISPLHDFRTLYYPQKQATCEFLMQNKSIA